MGKPKWSLWQRVAYRVGQVLWGLRPQLAVEDLVEVRRWLSASAYALWERQSPRDRAHSLRVLRTLQAEGWDAPPLMRAALLHDVGKIEAPISLVHRTVWVLAWAVAPRWAATWLPQPQGWRYPFWVLAEHPRLGARLAREAGADAQTVWLIEHHQDWNARADPHLGEWLAALQEADERN